jgi:hypothetical protein
LNTISEEPGVIGMFADKGEINPPHNILPENNDEEDQILETKQMKMNKTLLEASSVCSKYELRKNNSKSTTPK